MKIPVAVLGATGCVGQKLVSLLASHPLFTITSLAASPRSIGKKFFEGLRNPDISLSEKLLRMTLKDPTDSFEEKIIFSALPSAVALKMEKRLAEEGATIISNAKSFRFDPTVPLLIPEINPDHLDLLAFQSTSGKIITNPNCVVAGLVPALKPLEDRFGLEAVHVVTLQGISGAGFSGVSACDILGNVIPYIEGEEEKIEKEPLKILGTLSEGCIREASFSLQAQCNRVPVRNGHLINLSFSLKKKAFPEEVIQAWTSFRQPHPRLPTAPQRVLCYFREKNFPQPSLHLAVNNGMTVCIGHLRPSSLFDYKVTLLVDNLMRGAAGAALFNAELLVGSSLKRKSKTTSLLPI